MFFNRLRLLFALAAFVISAASSASNTALLNFTDGSIEVCYFDQFVFDTLYNLNNVSNCEPDTIYKDGFDSAAAGPIRGTKNQ